MTSGEGGAFFDQFIEDYYAECEEHLATARRVLLALEETATRAAPEPQLLRELFRSLHTLKGLSGMVGDACAERVAHALEDSLRAAERTGAPFEARHLDAVFDGVELLERCISARRAGTADDATRDVDAALERLAAATPGAPGAPGAPVSRGAPVTTSAAATVPDESPAASGASGAAGAAGDAVIHLFAFAPSLELTQRGIGVDAIRARLGELGSILDAKPRLADGTLVFDFRVAVPPGRTPDDAWAADGLQWSVVPVAASERTGPDASSAAGAISAAASVVRVDLARLDGVMRMVGDLVVSRARLEEVLELAHKGTASDIGAVVELLEDTSAQMERQLRRLRESVMRIRLVPVGEVFERLRFAARDAIRESGRQVALTFHGQSTEIDKLLVDRLLEPLLHLVRNAVSHGIEAPDERRARGKPPEGRLTLRAAASGDRIRVEVEDDGAGIDVQRVAARARALGVLAPDEQLGEALDSERDREALLDVLCAPGFSTRDSADRTSGRGVGMDVVRSSIHALAGTLGLETRRGAGTCFVIELPLTLMIVDAVMVRVGGQEMAVPQPSLREIVQADASSVVRLENNDVISWRGGVLPLVWLAQLFGLPQAPRASVYVLVVGSEAAPMGLVVDRLAGLREIVVHPVSDPLVARPGIAGATELGDGRVSLILDVAALVRMGQERRDRRAWRVRQDAGSAAAVASATAHLPTA